MDSDVLAARQKDDQRRYDEIWQGAIAAALAAGATIGHHHGVGRLRAPFLGDEQGHGLSILRTLSAVCDPARIFSPRGGCFWKSARHRVRPSWPGCRSRRSRRVFR